MTQKHRIVVWTKVRDERKEESRMTSRFWHEYLVDYNWNMLRWGRLENKFGDSNQELVFINVNFELPNRHP